MKYSVYADTPLSRIPGDTESIHLVRPLSDEKIEKLLKGCRRLRKIPLSSSTKKRLSKESLRFLKKKGVSIETLSKRGRAIEIPMEKMLQVIEMRKDFRPLAFWPWR